MTRKWNPKPKKPPPARPDGQKGDEYFDTGRYGRRGFSSKNRDWDEPEEPKRGGPPAASH